MSEPQSACACHICGAGYDEKDDSVQYCTRCGWSLGYLLASVAPNPIPLVGFEATPCTLRLEHKGAGRVSIALADLPAGVQAAESANSYLPLTSQNPLQEWKFQVAGDLMEKEELVFYIDSNTTQEAPSSATGDFYRPADLAVQSHIPVRVPLVRQRLGPILVLNETLFFRSPRQNQFLYLQNEGDAPSELTLEVIEGDFQIEFPDKGLRTGDATIIQAREALQIAIAPPALIRGQEIYKGKLRVSGQGVAKPIETLLFARYPKPLEKPSERWIIGIDFGTYKSAVYVIDNLNAPDELVQVTWDDRGTTRHKLPSVVMYPPSGAPPRFAWQVPSTVTSDSLVVQSMKSQLYKDTVYEHEATGRAYTSLEVATHFLTFLYRQLRNNPVFQGEDPFANARIVMSLPVLDDQVQFQLQKERTLLAAKQAGFPALIETLSEPEAAAIDVIYHYEQFGIYDLQDGDCICVFDSGAGTTDICILKVYLSGGVPRFERLLRLGFPIGGDIVDALLAEHWASESTGGDILYSNDSFTGDIRAKKERLRFPDDESKIDADEREPLESAYFGEGAAVSWSLIAHLYEPYVQMMLETGVPADATYPRFTPSSEVEDWRSLWGRVPFQKAYPSLREKMQGFDQKIKWLCLTGGGSFIPCVVNRLLDMFASSKYTPKFITINAEQKEPAPLYTMNVARGAALSPLVDSSDLFPFTIGMRFESPSNAPKAHILILAGTSPHTHSREVVLNLPPAEVGTMTLFVKTKIDGEDKEERERLLYKTFLDAPPARALRMSARLQYRADARLHLVLKYPRNGASEAPDERDIIVM